MLNKEFKKPRPSLRKESNHRPQSAIAENILKQLDSKYIFNENLGEGSFGSIVSVTDKNTKEKYALKIIKMDKDLKGSFSFYYQEIKILKLLQGEIGFPKLYNNGISGNNYLLFLSLLGDNIGTLLYRMQGRFTLPTISNIAVQMLKRLEVLHLKNIVHRDLKPENFVVDARKSTKIYLIDFGLSKIIVKRDGTPIEPKKYNGVIGTARYASVHAHWGQELYPRDDLESLGYILVYMAKGVLPWMNIDFKDKEDKLEKMLFIKLNTKIETLCEGLPPPFLDYFMYIRKLEIHEKPDYKLLKDILNKIYEGETQPLDWNHISCSNTEETEASTPKGKPKNMNLGIMGKKDNIFNPDKSLYQKMKSIRNKKYKDHRVSEFLLTKKPSHVSFPKINENAKNREEKSAVDDKKNLESFSFDNISDSELKEGHINSFINKQYSNAFKVIAKQGSFIYKM